jgi:protein-L-isoaspartate O-methyltransferase
VVGLGGPGCLAVKFATALSARVAVFTTSPGEAAAARELGAAEVIVAGQGTPPLDRFDFILDTASAKHDPSPYLRALRMDGALCMLGIPDRYERLQEQEARLLARRTELEDDLGPAAGGHAARRRRPPRPAGRRRGKPGHAGRRRTRCRHRRPPRRYRAALTAYEQALFPRSAEAAAAAAYQPTAADMIKFFGPSGQ